MLKMTTLTISISICALMGLYSAFAMEESKDQHSQISGVSSTNNISMNDTVKDPFEIAHNTFLDILTPPEVTPELRVQAYYYLAQAHYYEAQMQMQFRGQAPGCP